MANLFVWSPVGYWADGPASYIDTKSYTGMLAFRDFWPGKLTFVTNKNTGKKPEFGVKEYRLSEAKFDLKAIEAASILDLQPNDVLYLSADDHRQLAVCREAQRAGAKVAYIIENTLKTRIDIIKAEAPSLATRAKATVWTLLTERKRRKALAGCDIVHANGVPAFELYARKDRDDLLFFDTRTAKDEVVTTQQLDRRLRERDPQLLRLGFSGRLERLKGVQFLPQLAQSLEGRIGFALDVFGDGSQMRDLALAGKRLASPEHLSLHGAVDFNTELLPYMKSKVDLFVCPHVQGDPSCTYLETLACGVPIVGFGNEAFQGLLSVADVGWSVPVGNAKALAQEIARLSRHPEEVARKSANARAFAVQHDFDTEFRRRIDSLKALLRR